MPPGVQPFQQDPNHSSFSAMESPLTNGHSTAVATTNGHANGSKRKLDSSDESSSDEPTKKRPHQKTARLTPTQSWVYSSPVGGVYINRDPIWVTDEQHLIVALPFALEVYSTATSLRIHQLAVGTSSPIVAFGLSGANTDHVFAVTQKGTVILFDWTAGTKVIEWELDSRVVDVKVSMRSEGDAFRDVIFALLVDEEEKLWTVQYFELPMTAEEDWASIMLYQTKSALTNIEIGHGGRAIAALSGKNLLLGCLYNRMTREEEYEWLDYPFPKTLTRVDIRNVTPSKKRMKQRGTEVPCVDIVVGDEKGKLHQYDDMLFPLFNSHRSKDAIAETQKQCRPHHWHRKAVNAVKWSKDANYLISGGLEETLVLWQLDTNLRQTLPHLSAAIANIAISKTGRHYALHLADNSIMVLSTAELKPSANIVGIQCKASLALPQLKPWRGNTEKGLPGLLKTVALCHPTMPRRLLLAVPTSQSARLEKGGSASCLQGWDILAGRQLSRQALTETNTTNFKTGPQGNILLEPTIVSFAVSFDGQWLASIEEWCPPSEDKPADKRGREVTLKIWKAGERWELVTRVDVPHGLTEDGFGAIRTTEVVAHPSKPEFATVGFNGVRTWSPKQRLRGGVLVKTEGGGVLQNWICSGIVPLQLVHGRAAEIAASPTLRYSPDASVMIVAGPTSTERSSLFIIALEYLSVLATWTAVSTSPILKIALLERRLVFASSKEIGWLDIASGQVEHTIGINMPACSPQRLADMTHMAVLPSSSLFAVSVPVVDGSQNKGLKRRAVCSETFVFSPKLGEDPLFARRKGASKGAEHKSEVVMSLVAIEKGGDEGLGPAFVVVSGTGEVSLLRHSAVVTVGDTPASGAPVALPKIQTEEALLNPAELDAEEHVQQLREEEEMAAIGSGRTAEILTGAPAYSSSVTDMFFRLASAMLERS